MGLREMANYTKNTLLRHTNNMNIADGHTLFNKLPDNLTKRIEDEML